MWKGKPDWRGKSSSLPKLFSKGIIKMPLWAIVPVKPLRRGKSRLSPVLSEDERTALNQTLLTNTLKILSSVQQIDRIMVVSRDPAALTLARDFGARTVLENGNPELNTALRRASMVAKTHLATRRSTAHFQARGRSVSQTCWKTTRDHHLT